MIFQELLARCDEAESWADKFGSKMRPSFNVMIYKRCTGKRTKIIPGLWAHLIQWADGNEPVCMGVVYCDEVRRAIAKLEAKNISGN